MLKIFSKKYRLFKAEFYRFSLMSQVLNRNFTVNIEDCFPCLTDKTETTEFDRHYVFHPAWAARILASTRPAEHLDISSSLHFCSIVSAFVPVKFYDYRPAALGLDNLTSDACDLLDLPFADQSVDSLSCMHVVEHVGLGRYGDPLDPDGDLKAMTELKRVLAIGGSLLFVVPVGKPRIMFNAHRIYSYDQIMACFSDLELREFALIPDNFSDGGLVRHATKDMADVQRYACGCFWFVRK